MPGVSETEKDAIRMIGAVKQLAGASSGTFKDFALVLYDYDAGRVSTDDVRSHLTALLSGYPKLRKQFDDLGKRAGSPRLGWASGAGGAPSSSRKRARSEAAALHQQPLWEGEGEIRRSGAKNCRSNFAHLSRGTFRYRRIPVVDAQQPVARALVQRERQNGNPLILTNHPGWTGFAQTWVRDDGCGGGGAGSSQGDGGGDGGGGAGGGAGLDAEQFLHDVGADTEVPIVRPGYDEKQPVKEHLCVRQFMDEYWCENDRGAYLHQWQFAICPRAEVRRALCGRSAPLPCLGHNLLKHWIDLCRGDNPLQYLFMGPAHTYSKLHRDNGGCAILIAPVTGRKEVILVHRDDTVHLYDLAVDVSSPDLHRFPSLAFARVWRQTVEPGQILLMPAGTYHACRNLDPCLSYSCFHLDSVNLPLFYKSFLAEDAPELSHAEILWNAAHDLMDILEQLRVLRHFVRAIELDASTPAASGWDWHKLLRSVDYTLSCTLQSAIERDRVRRSSHGGTSHPGRVERGVRGASGARGGGGRGEGAHDVDEAAWAAQQRAAWARLALRKGQAVLVRHYNKVLKGLVEQTCDDKRMAMVHYMGWSEQYNEMYPVEEMRLVRKPQKDEQSDEQEQGQGQGQEEDRERVRAQGRIEKNDQVIVRWGARGDDYHAVCLCVCTISAARVRFSNFGEEWHQWVSALDVVTSKPAANG
eukprot:g2218.t1